MRACLLFVSTVALSLCCTACGDATDFEDDPEAGFDVGDDEARLQAVAVEPPDEALDPPADPIFREPVHTASCDVATRRCGQPALQWVDVPHRPSQSAFCGRATPIQITRDQASPARYVVKWRWCGPGTERPCSPRTLPLGVPVAKLVFGRCEVPLAPVTQNAYCDGRTSLGGLCVYTAGNAAACGRVNGTPVVKY